MSLTMTASAIEHVQRHLASRGTGIGIRVGVQTTGCSGLSYVLEFVDDVNPEDNTFNQGEFSLVVDPKSLFYLDGTELDFVKEGLNEGFQFNNPNAKNACGCGESFHV